MASQDKITEWNKRIRHNQELFNDAKEYIAEEDPNLLECFNSMQKSLFEELSKPPTDILETLAIGYADDYQYLGEEIVEKYATHRAEDDESQAACDAVDEIQGNEDESA